MIDKATAERIKDAADIVEVVGDYVRLIRRGANYMGLCPFHNERTPSFSVNKARNFCYCFSCHKGGSPVNFIMEMEGIGYQDALRQLARRYGITIEERELTDAERESQSKREAMFVANEWAMQKFQHFLTDTDDGRNIGLSYLYGRGITDEAIRHFRLGYAPERRVLEALARKDGFNTDLLVELGLLIKGDHGLYDRFRGRVIYPVLNAAGKVVAFGGRDLKGSKAKYINSPETPLYHKSNELYGLHQARVEMGRADCCYLVEGYMDVIGMWQAGLRNAIASSGTALTDSQIALIHRFTRNVTLVYDGDPAGIKASMRGIDMLLAQGMDIKVLLLPDNDDPDSFARKHTPEEVRRYFAGHSTDFITFKTQVLLQDARDPIRRTEAARSIVQSLGAIPDKIKRNVYIQTCSSLLGIDEQVLSYEADIVAQKLIEQRRHVGTHPGASASSPATPVGMPPSSPAPGTPLSSSAHSGPAPLQKLERRLLRLCVRYGMTHFSPAATDDDPEPTPVFLAEYVNSELEADHMHLTDPLCSALMTEILALRETYAAAEASKIEELEKAGEERLSTEIAKLSETESSIPELEQAEQRLTEAIQADFDKALFEFSATWLGRQLSSHEDDGIRTLVCQMVAEPYTLSRYHRKTGTVQTEAERLPEILPRTINELRAGVLEQQIADVKVRILSCASDAEKLEAMKQLAELLDFRKHLAFLNGERILSSR